MFQRKENKKERKLNLNTCLGDFFIFIFFVSDNHQSLWGHPLPCFQALIRPSSSIPFTPICLYIVSILLYLFFLFPAIPHILLPIPNVSASPAVASVGIGSLFALLLAGPPARYSSTVFLNVTSHLWLRPVLFLAGRLKCEGSQWEDKYKGLWAQELSRTRTGSSPPPASPSSPKPR